MQLPCFPDPGAIQGPKWTLAGRSHVGFTGGFCMLYLAPNRGDLQRCLRGLGAHMHCKPAGCRGSEGIWVLGAWKITRLMSAGGRQLTFPPGGNPPPQGGNGEGTQRISLTPARALAPVCLYLGLIRLCSPLDPAADFMQNCRLPHRSLCPATAAFVCHPAYTSVCVLGGWGAGVLAIHRLPGTFATRLSTQRGTFLGPDSGLCNAVSLWFPAASAAACVCHSVQSPSSPGCPCPDACTAGMPCSCGTPALAFRQDPVVRCDRNAHSLLQKDIPLPGLEPLHVPSKRAPRPGLHGLELSIAAAGSWLPSQVSCSMDRRWYGGHSVSRRTDGTFWSLGPAGGCNESVALPCLTGGREVRLRGTTLQGRTTEQGMAVMETARMEKGPM